jgi:hypothetical protein
MKHRILIILLAAMCAVAPASGQSIRTLGFNTTNGEIVYSGTNALTFTNEVLSFSYGPGLLISNGVIEGNGRSIALEDGSVIGTFNFQNAVEFSAAATTRTNLSLGATWLTNTNVTNFRTAIGLGATNDVTFSRITAGFLQSTTTNASIELDDDNFIIEAALLEIRTPITFDNSTNASVTRTNLGLPLPALTNTNVTNFLTAIGLGATNDVVFGSIETQRLDIQSGTNLYILLDDGIADFNVAASFNHPDGILFTTNTGAAATRTNLGLPLPALTNTSNVTTMRALAGSTNTNQPYSGTILCNLDGDVIEITVSNGIILNAVTQ